MSKKQNDKNTATDYAKYMWISIKSSGQMKTDKNPSGHNPPDIIPLDRIL